MSKEKARIEIEVISDVMCPWCWVGKKQLEEAMRRSQDKYNFTVRWQPYLLRPDMPPEGFPKIQGQNERLKSFGRSVGIEFTGKAERYPNTLQAHTLLEYAVHSNQMEKQNEIAEKLFKSYFTDGLLPETDTLLSIAADCNMKNTDDVKKFITNQQNLQNVYKTAMSWRDKGIAGVPNFYMNGGPTFSGAQDVDVFIRIFDVVAKKRPLDSSNAKL